MIGTITALWGGVMIRMLGRFMYLSVHSYPSGTVLRRIPWTWDLLRSIIVDTVVTFTLQLTVCRFCTGGVGRHLDSLLFLVL